MIGAFGLLVSRRQPINPVTEIEQVLKANEFIPYDQPIVDIRSGRLLGAEVLARWRKADDSSSVPCSSFRLWSRVAISWNHARNYAPDMRGDRRRGRLPAAI
ncbi:MAG: EAL domain-containing protein [Rhizobiales bacterium]|nr:EAL domain-containing protein [Hyphomicrobiales bacterium]